MSRVLYRLNFPQGLEPAPVLQFMRSLSARARHGWLRTADPVILEVAVVKGQLGWYLEVEQREERQVLSALRMAIPSLTALSASPLPSVGIGWELRMNSSRRSLFTEGPDEVAAQILQALGHAAVSETVRLQWLVGPWIARAVVPPATSQRRPKGMDLKPPGPNSEQVKALRVKRSEPMFGVVARLGITASEGRTKLLRQRVVGALQLLRAPGVGFERRALPSGWVVQRIASRTQPAFGWPCILNARELTACVGWPIGNPVLTGVTYSGVRQLPPALGTRVRANSTGGRVTGRSTYPGDESLLGLTAEAGLRHLLALGPTGVGKSTVLANLALQDIQAGRGVVVIDPGAKGDLVRDIADRIPEHRLDDVVWLDPNDDRPVGLNVLGGSNHELAVDGITHLIHELWSAHWGPRTADVLHHALLTLSRHRGMTLCELPPLLLNTSFRRQLLTGTAQDTLGVGPFWAWFEALSDAERATVVGPVLNKLRAFTQRESIRGVIGQSEGFDLLEVFTKRRILLVNLASGQIGSEAAQLLGALVLNQLWLAITIRSSLPAERRRPTFVYIDEFQQLLRLPLDLSDALVQARGLGVGFVLASQHTGQWTPSVKAAVLANVRSKIVFGLSRTDASLLAPELGSGLTSEDLQALDAYETYQQLHVPGAQTRTSSARTLPLISSLHSGRKVRELSRQRFGKPRTEVDAELLARRTSATSASPVGSRRRGGTS